MALTPLKVTAHLLRGASLDPLTLDLAGILASQLWVEAPKGRESSEPNPDDLDLPLDICEGGEAGWHWLASCAVTNPLEETPQEPRTYYRVVDDSAASRLGDRPIPYWSPRSSAYRDMMMPAHITLTPTLTWWAVGDEQRIKELLAPIRSLGKRRNKGEGRVLRWEVKKVQSDKPWELAHMGESEEIIRPCPTECAEKLGVPYSQGWHALRPPSWNPDRLKLLAIPAEEELYIPEEWDF